MSAITLSLRLFNTAWCRFHRLDWISLAQIVQKNLCTLAKVLFSVVFQFKQKFSSLIALGFFLQIANTVLLNDKRLQHFQESVAKSCTTFYSHVDCGHCNILQLFYGKSWMIYFMGMCIFKTGDFLFNFVLIQEEIFLIDCFGLLSADY